MSSTVLSVASRAVLDACSRLGLDPDSLLQAAGAERGLVFDPNARLPAEQADAIWKAAFRAAEDPGLALHAAEALPFGAYRVLDFIVANAPEVKQALERLCRYFSLVDQRAQLTLDGDEAAQLTLSSNGGALPVAAQEYTLAAIALRLRASTAIDVPLESAQFTYSTPNSRKEYERIFCCELRFEAPTACLVFSASTLKLKIPGADAALFSVLEEHAGRLVRELPAVEQGLVEQLITALQAELRGGDISAKHLARQVGVSERTMQRRLEEEDTSYGLLLSNARRSMAEKYLRQPHVSLTEIGWLLGFSEQSSFTRAFKRWTGQSPGAWRSARN